MDRLTESKLEIKDFEQWRYDMGMAFARMVDLFCKVYPMSRTLFIFVFEKKVEAERLIPIAREAFSLCGHVGFQRGAARLSRAACRPA